MLKFAVPSHALAAGFGAIGINRIKRTLRGIESQNLSKLTPPSLNLSFGGETTLEDQENDHIIDSAGRKDYRLKVKSLLTQKIKANLPTEAHFVLHILASTNSLKSKCSAISTIVQP